MPALSACAQHARAEAVDGRDPGALDRARLRAAIELGELRPHTRAHLGGGLVGERGREDRLHRHVVLDHGAHEALHQHGRLARAGAGADHQRAIAARDRALLLLGQPAHPRTCRSRGRSSRRSRRRCRDRSRARRGACGRPPRAPGRAPSRAWRGTPRAAGGRCPKSEPSSSTSSATMPRGVSDLPSGTYTPPAARSPSSRLHDEHVERRLEAVLGLPGADLYESTRHAPSITSAMPSLRRPGRCGRAPSGRARSPPARRLPSPNGSSRCSGSKPPRGRPRGAGSGPGRTRAGAPRPSRVCLGDSWNSSAGRAAPPPAGARRAGGWRGHTAVAGLLAQALERALQTECA